MYIQALIIFLWIHNIVNKLMESNQIPLQRTWVNETHINFHRILGSSSARLCVYTNISATQCVCVDKLWKKYPFWLSSLKFPKLCCFHAASHQNGISRAQLFAAMDLAQNTEYSQNQGQKFCFVLFYFDWRYRPAILCIVVVRWGCSLYIGTYFPFYFLKWTTCI